MSAPMSEEGKQLLKILADGAWHPYEEVLARLMASVAPGKALRNYERRSGHYHANYAERRGPELSEDEKITSGQRSLARRAIRSLSLRFIETRQEPDGTEFVRKREQPVPVRSPRRTDECRCAEMVACDTCGDLTDDPAGHANLHQPPEPEITEADVVADARLRLLLRQEMAGVLDNFQLGLQEFLMARFADLEASGLPSVFRNRTPHAPRF